MQKNITYERNARPDCGFFSGLFGSPDARQHFAAKGLAAADGIIVMPEAPSDWNLTARDVAETTLARAYLIEALDNGGRDTVPDKAAIAQARFDCWAAGQGKNWNKDTGCKYQFKKTLQSLQAALAATYAPPTATQTAAAGEFPPPVADAPQGALAPVQQAMFIVFFDWDKIDLSAGANDVLDAVAQELKARRDVEKIVVAGHADTSGGARYNKNLSLKRAHAVRGALAARGIPADKLRTEGHGENDLLVKTPDNIREPANRRAQITLE